MAEHVLSPKVSVCLNTNDAATGVRRRPQEPRKVAARSNHRFYRCLKPQLVLPLRDRRTLRLEADYAEETATAYRPHRYAFRDVDIVLLEGIFIYKRAHRPHFDLGLWIDCTFDTALERALRRAQEGLPPAETITAYRTIYFPAQRLHQVLDQPRGGADVVIVNDPRLAPPGGSEPSVPA